MRPALRDEDGFTMIELIVALMVLTIGILGLFGGFDTARKLSLVSERETTMAHIAQQQIENLEGFTYKTLALNATSLSTSTDSTNPDYYVSAGSPQTLQWDRNNSANTEQLVFDTTNGLVTPVQNWSQGGLTGQIYDFITWSSDSQCSPGCTPGNNYKRITVAVTVTQGLQPNPVWVESFLADPKATAQSGSPANPLKDPSTTCTNAGSSAPCTAGIDIGTANTFYLHDWAATNTGNPTAPTASHATHQTVGTAAGKNCTSTPSQTGNANNINGCPTPDLMDTTPPAGTTLYSYSTDQGTSGYPGGRLLAQTCPSSSTPCGTDATTDCNGGGWSATLQPNQSEFWVTAPLTAALKLNGNGALSLFTQTRSGIAENTSFCLEIYDVPPSGGTAGSLTDLNAYPPTDLGGAAYVPPTNSGGGNWPTGSGEVNFTFNFRGSNAAYTVPVGDRIGARIWMKSSTTNPLAAIYDNGNYISQIQLNNS